MEMTTAMEGEHHMTHIRARGEARVRTTAAITVNEKINACGINMLDSTNIVSANQSEGYGG